MQEFTIASLHKNKRLVVSVLVSLFLSLSLIYSGLNKFFKFVPLSLPTLAGIFVYAFSIVLIADSVKIVMRNSNEVI